MRQPLFDLTHLTGHSTPATDCFRDYLPKSLNSGNRLFWGLFTQITQLRQPIVLGYPQIFLVLFGDCGTPSFGRQTVLVVSEKYPQKIIGKQMLPLS